MSRSYERYGLPIAVLLLVLANAALICLDFKQSKNILTFAMLDVGQGDALFIESPQGAQIVVDAGPARKVLGPLRRIMSPFDQTIDAIIITNPDADHIGGFAEILKNYRVGLALEPGTSNNSKTYGNLKSELEKRKVKNMLLKRGMRLDMGGGAVIDVLFPDRDVSSWSTNDGSAVARLSYGNTSIMLMGDATSTTERIILEEGGEVESRVLKVGHHGSRSSTSRAFVNKVNPGYALISSGRGNSYGHPHAEVLKTLGGLGVKILRTDMLGTIVIRSDGTAETLSFHR